MQQSINSSQLKGRADGAFNIWGETGNTWENINKYKDFWPATEECKSDSTLEAGTDVSSTPNSISGSVITSSNLCGVQGTTISVNASTSGNVYNAHCGAQCSNASPHVTSHCSGSSMLCGSFPSQGDSQNSSNSQSAQSTTSESGTISGHPRRPKTEQRDSVMWSVATSGDGPQGSNTPMNQNTIGAKNALSEPHGLQQASTSQHSMNDHLPPHPDMQTNVHAVDPTQRYNDMATNHGTNGMGRNFSGGNGNGAYRNVGGSNGAHSNNPQLLQVGATAESNGSHNQNSTYGAQYNSSANRAKSQVTGCENNSCSNGSGASYSGWQGLNTSAASSSSNNGWNIPESSLTGRTGHGSQSNPTSSDNVNDGEENMMVDSDMSYSGLIGATGGSDYTEEQQNSNNYREGSTWGMPPPPRMGLLGGGESSLNAGSTGWGGPGPSGASGSGWGGGGRQSGNGTATEMAGNPNAGMSPPKPHNSWAQAAGKGLNPPPQNNSANNSQNGNGQSESGNLSSSVPGSVTKVRIDEHVTELRIAAAFSDGWGQTPVNQDTPWDVPPATPEPNTSKENTTNAVWRAPVNNGTEIWENNLRLNKGVTTPITSANTPPWGHTPSTNIGGHWGDDDSSSNMWTGVPQNNTSNNASNWVDPNSNANASNMWGNPPPPPPPSEKHWGNQGGSSWGDNGTPDNGTSVWNPPVSKQRNVGSWSPVATPKKDIQPSGWEEPSPPTARRPMPNYDDGTAVWGNPSRQGKVSHWKDMPAAKPITNSGSNSGPPTAMPPASIGGGGVPPAGPGMIRLPSGAAVNNKGEIASSVWGKQPQLNRNTSWTDMPSHRDSPNIGNWGEDPHMQNQMKSIPGTPNASSAAFGGGWGEQQPGPMPPYWGAKPKGPSNWAEGQVDTSTWGGPSKQRGDMMQEGWPAAEDMSGNMWCEGAKDSSIGYWNGENQNPAIPWVGRKLKGGKPLTRDLIWASKQFRLLLEMGVKKEDAENALRNNNMNLDDAIGELHSASRDNNMMDVDGYNGRKMRPGNVADEMAIPEHVLDPSYGPGNFHGAGAFQGPQILPGFAGAQGFKPQVKGSGLNSNTPSLLTNAALGGQASSLSSISSLSPALVQKILQQQQQAQPFTPNNIPQNPLGNQGSRMGQNNFPSAAQLRHLVQQIQMAVQAGHLNPQILNQPLAPQTLQLLYQLLQQIKVLHQLQQQQIFQNQHLTKPGPGGPGNPSGLQLNVQITQTKQRIVNLQNQIAAQQALFLKQQLQHQPPQHPSLHTAQPSADIFKPNIDPMPALHTDFRELSLKDAALQTQSRLNQWKLPSYEKDENPLGSSSGSQGGNMNANNNFNAEFSRAPGPLSSKPSSSASSAMPNSGPNLHPLLSQGESAWSSLSRAQGDSGWPDAATSSAGVNDNASNANNINNTNNTSVATTVPNSGNSVQTSNSDNKEPSPTPPTSGPSTSSASHTSYLTDLVPEFEPGKPWKGTSQMKNVEDDPHITPGSIARSPLSLNTIKDSDLFNWNSKTSPATTGNDTLVSSLASLTSSTWVFTPPAVPNSSSVPCKSGNVKSSWGSLTADTATGSDLWGSSITKARGPPPGLSGQGWDRQNSSNFLVLRNLTPQIDGSTLKTLCMQHGPLQLFHLFLNHGIALVRYSTREEAAKAQSALTNCVLGNTTILADIPSETEVQQYLVVANGQPAGGNMGWPTPPQGGNAATSFRANNASYPFGSSTGSTTNTGKLDSTGWNGNSLNMPTSQLWSFPSSGGGSLWATTQSINDHDQSTSSSLNSYLPGDLLNGEPM